MTVGALDDLLTRAGVHVVQGNPAARPHSLALDDGQDLTVDERRQRIHRTIGLLRSNPQVRLAEPVAGEASE